MMYFFLLIVATVLFSLQFLFNQKFEQECGSSLNASMIFSLYSAIGGFVILFVLNGFSLSLSFFSLITAIVYSIIGIAYTIAGIKAFGEVNLSAYSVFSMLGGMLMPSLYGIIFCGEAITAGKILCAVCMTAALLLIIDFNKNAGKKIYYISVFVLNGLVGVVSVIHQKNAYAIDSFGFLMLARISTTIISLPFYFKMSKNARKTSLNAKIYSFGYAAFCGIGNLLVLIALKHLPASIQYPIITGGVMIMSLIISIVRKETVTRKNIVSTVIAFISTVLIAL